VPTLRKTREAGGSLIGMVQRWTSHQHFEALVSNQCMRLLCRLAVVSGILVLLSLGALGVYLRQLKRSADEVVRVSFELSQRENLPTLDEIRRQFGAQLKQPDPCIASGCGYEVMLSNRVLAEIHLAPYTALRSSFWAKDGVLESNSLEFWTAGSQRRMVGMTVLTKYCDQCDSFSVIPCEDSMELGTSGSVEIGYRSAIRNKRTALALDTACLTKLRGCDTIADLHPTVWQRTPVRTIRCRVSNH